MTEPVPQMRGGGEPPVLRQWVSLNLRLLVRPAIFLLAGSAFLRGKRFDFIEMTDQEISI
jgi:hypothetical protein